MLRSLYSGVSGMRGFQTKLDVIGNNIANVNTIGFKASRVLFKDILNQTVMGGSAPQNGGGGTNSKQIGLGSSLGAIDTVYTQGSSMNTNISTDLRIDGEGFFALKQNADQEQPYLSRSGTFNIDVERNLVNGDGLLVLDSSGQPMRLPEGITSFSISRDGEIISVRPDGTMEATGVRVGIVKITNPNGLEKVGGSLFRNSPNAETNLAYASPNDAVLGTGSIISGQLEMSNVDLTAEFAEMIIAQRGFQSNARIITTSDEVLQEVVGLKR